MYTRTYIRIYIYIYICCIDMYFHIYIYIQSHDLKKSPPEASKKHSLFALPGFADVLQGRRHAHTFVYVLHCSMCVFCRVAVFLVVSPGNMFTQLSCCFPPRAQSRAPSKASQA